MASIKSSKQQELGSHLLQSYDFKIKIKNSASGFIWTVLS